jgi:hypothetical protein
VRSKGALFVMALVGAAALTAAPAVAARADTSSSLPQLAGFHQIVVDDAAGYVFLSEGIDSLKLMDGSADPSAIVVTDLSGRYVTKLDAGHGVEGLALSSDGSTLYAALAADNAIAVIDTSTLAQTTQYPLPSSAAQPYDLALQSGKLWVSYNGADGGGKGAIGDFELSAASPTFETQAATLSPTLTGWYSAPAIASDPSDTGVLVAAQEDVDPDAAAAYAVTADPATVLDQTSALDPSCYGQGVTAYPGGAQFAACGEIYGAATMSEQAGGNPAGAAASAVSPDGSLEAFGGGDSVYVYQAQSSAALNTYALAGSATVASSGLAFSSDGTTLYAVEQNGGAYSLRTLDDPGVPHSFLTLSAPSTVFAGVGYALTGSLALNTGAPPTGTRITIARSSVGGTAAPQVLTATTAADGSFSSPQTVTVPGTYRYTASYPAATETASATATVTVKHSTSWLQLNGAGSRVLTGQSFTLNGELAFNAPSPSTRSVPPTGTAITVTRTRAGTATTRFVVKTGADGVFLLTDHLPDPGTYTYSARYAGNAGIAAAGASVAVTVHLPSAAVALRTSAGSIGYEGTVTVRAHLGKTYTNRTLSIYAQTVGSATMKLLKRERVDAQGNVTVRYVAAHSTRFIAQFSGDARYARTGAEDVVGVGVKISMASSGYFSTQNEDGLAYHLYHHTNDLNADVAVAPSKRGGCVKLQVQEYDQQGKNWFANATFGCYSLNRSSKLATSLGLTSAAGALYRVRAEFVPSATDTNIGTDGAWFYFKVVT